MTNLTQYYFHKAGSLLLYATPMGILFAVNYKAYTSSGGIGFFGYFIIMLGAIALSNKLGEAAKKNTMLTLSAAIFIIALIMQYFASQLLLISSISLVGSLLSSVTDKVADVYYSKAYSEINGKLIKTDNEYLSLKSAWKLAYLGG